MTTIYNSSDEPKADTEAPKANLQKNHENNRRIHHQQLKEKLRDNLQRRKIFDARNKENKQESFTAKIQDRSDNNSLNHKIKN